MIVDRLVNRRIYGSLQRGIQLGFEYLESFDGGTSDGRYPIEGALVFALVQSYDTAPATERQFETHRRHIDIQYLVEGQERILHTPSDALRLATPYEEEHDAAFYDDPPASSSILLGPGDFALFFPDDGHKGGCMAGGRRAVRKVVVKVNVDT